MMFADLPQRLAMHCLRRIGLWFAFWLLTFGTTYTFIVVTRFVDQLLGGP